MDVYVCFIIFDWFFEILVYFFEKMGLYVLFFIVFYWVLMIIVLVFVLLYYLVLIINIFIWFVFYWWVYFCLFCNCLMKFFEKNLGLDYLLIGFLWKKRLFEFFIVNMCFLMMFLYFFFVVESLMFFVEIFVYILVGIILNVDVILKYVLFIFMFLFYICDSFGSVICVYMIYIELIINVLRKIEKE